MLFFPVTGWEIRFLWKKCFGVRISASRCPLVELAYQSSNEPNGNAYKIVHNLIQ